MNEVLLQSLVASLPSASLKLSAAWDGLSTESQMEVLQALRPSRLPSDVGTKAMASSNAFVRYLAAECVARNVHLEFPKDDHGVKGMRLEVDDDFRPAMIAALNDPDPFVRSVVAPEGVRGTAYSSPAACEEFWTLSRPARFRYVRAGHRFSGDVVAVIEHGLAHNVPDDAVSEVLAEFIDTVKATDSLERYSLLKFAERAPASYAEFIRRELEVPRAPNSLIAWVEPRVIPADKEKVYFKLKEPAGVVAHLSRQACLIGAFISLLIGAMDLLRTGTIEPLPFLVALVLWTPPLLKALLIHEVEKESSFPRSGLATPLRLRWIRLAWRLSWLLIVVVGVGFAAILTVVFGPGLVDAYKTTDLRVLVSANLGLLLLLMWRVAQFPEMGRPNAAKPKAQ